VPVTEEEIDTDLHFITFVKAKGKDGWVAGSAGVQRVAEANGRLISGG
jgi:hypothetical protein